MVSDSALGKIHKENAHVVMSQEWLNKSLWDVVVFFESVDLTLVSSIYLLFLAWYHFAYLGENRKQVSSPLPVWQCNDLNRIPASGVTVVFLLGLLESRLPMLCSTCAFKYNTEIPFL